VSGPDSCNDMPEISPELLSLRSYMISAELLWTMFAPGGELLCLLTYGIAKGQVRSRNCPPWDQTYTCAFAHTEVDPA
jgi:hypothetical protein